MLLLSLNFSWITVWIARVGNKELGGHFVGPYISALTQRMYRSFPTAEGKTVMEQILASVGLAVLVFLLLYLFKAFRAMRGFLASIGGAVALAGFPVVALCFPLYFLQSVAYERRFEIGSGWLVLEAALVLICGVVYYFQRWPFRSLTSIGLLLVHFGFWSWLTGTHVNLLNEARRYHSVGPAFWVSICFYWGFPALGFLASLAWAFFLRTATLTSLLRQRHFGRVA